MDAATKTDYGTEDVTFANYEWELIRAHSSFTSVATLPTCRNCHTATQFKQYMIVFGGKEGEGRKKFCNDVHILDIERYLWLNNIKIVGQCPDVRMGHSAQLYGENSIVYYGGWNGYNVLDDIHQMVPREVGNGCMEIEWEGVKAENASPKRQFHTANIQEHWMYVFGGGDGKMWLSDLYCFDLLSKTWRLVETSGKSPSGRLQHSSVIHNGKIYIFGGEPDRLRQLNDLYSLDLKTATWTLVKPSGSQPSARVSASAVIMSNKIFFFGGYDGTQWRTDVYIYNIYENQWEYVTTEKSPKPRCRHSGVCYKGQIIIFGGNDSEKSYNDVYILKQKNQMKIAEPSLHKDLGSLLFKDTLSDVSFKVESQLIYAHKIILAARCEYFRELFTNPLQQQEVIEINDTRLEVFRALLEFIYKDEVTLSREISHELMAQADKYMLNRLKNICEEYLVRIISLKNVIEIVNLAEKYNAQELKAQGMKFLIDNRTKISQSPDIHLLSKEVLIELFKISK